MLFECRLRDNGTYNINNYNIYFSSFRKNNYDYKKANSETMKDLKKYWQEKSFIDFARLMKHKAAIVYENDSAKMEWVETSLKNINSITFKTLKMINNIYFMCLNILMILGTINMIKTQNIKYFFTYLIFFGSMLLILLVEAQNRYIYCIQPILCVLAVIGIMNIKNIIKEVKNAKIFRINKNKTMD